MRVTLAFATLAISATSACKKTEGTPVCPGAYHAASEAQRKADFTCSCEAGAAHGTVWGVGVYTTDSSICAAAVHAGALGAGAVGSVTVRPAVGCAAYTGSVANGVTSNAWGPFDSSFYFPLHGDGKCATATAPAPVADALSPCPTTWDAVTTAAPTSTQLACSCATVPSAGAVWGVGTFTSDSSICRAAVHAGAVPPTGGSVVVKKAAGCAQYKGSEANGIHSDSWGSHAGSFYFDGKGDGSCGS